MRIFIFIALTLLGSLGAYAQNRNQENYARFYELLKAGDQAALQRHVGAWEQADPHSAEMHIANYNYYLQRNMRTINSIGRMADGRRGMFPQVVFDPDDFIIATGYLERGISKYPSRMDMITGLREVYWLNRNFDKMTSLILRTIDHSRANSQRWVLVFNQPIPPTDSSGHEYLENFLHDSLNMLNGWLDLAAPEYKRIADTALEIYPNSVILLNAASQYYSNQQQHPQALSLLIKAHTINNQDEIVMHNLALTYVDLNQTAKAIGLFQRLTLSKDPEFAQYARDKVSELAGRLEQR
jgi:tetratricopeptide (TPR) repeat protein